MTRSTSRWLVCAGIALAAAGMSAPRGITQSLDGYWLSDGYGYFAEFSGGEMKLFEITPVSCISAETLVRNDTPPDSRGTRFMPASGRGGRFLSPDSSSDSMWLQSPGAASRTLFVRTPSRPNVCERPTPDDPATNFEVFAATFGAHHGFLKHRGVDWSAVVRANRSRVTATTTPAELLEVFKGMIDPLHDAHTFIDASSIRSGFQGKKPGTLLLTADEKRQTISILETRYLETPLRFWCNRHVGYARLKNHAIGYMRVDAFSGYTAAGGFDENASALDTALDEIMRDAQGLSALVIDVRLNGGGSDPLGVRIASRLTDAPYVAFVKRARNDPNEENTWTAPQPTTVPVASGPRFLKPVVELIGPDTVSAGETFTMALIGRRPQITRIGSHTQGVYSDVLGRRLPNGWRFGLPNEVFLTEQGRHYEAGGVPPDIAMAVFPKADLADGRDSVLEKAIAVLSTPAAGKP